MDQLKGQGGAIDLQIDYGSIAQVLLNADDNSSLPVRVCRLGSSQTVLQYSDPEGGWTLPDISRLRRRIMNNYSKEMELDLYLGDSVWIGSTEV